MTKKPKLENDYERMVPEFHKGTLTYAEHLTRYLAAQKIAKDKVVLDIASGSGYGSKLLSETASMVYGVDVDRQAIEYSKINYDAANIEYRLSDGRDIPLKNATVDIVITFETIEHIEDYQHFVKELKRVLKSDGLLIVSTPNDLEFAEGNHFHIHEFEYDELVRLLRKDFKNIESYYQGTWKYVAIADPTALQSEGEIPIKTLNLSPKSPEQYLYFYLLCSNRKITENIEPIAAVGEHYSDRQLVAEASANQSKQKEDAGYIAELNRVNDDLRRAYDDLSQKHNEITSSRSYLATQKINRLINRIKPR